MSKIKGSILEELTGFTKVSTKDSVVETRANHAMASAINLIKLIQESYPPEQADELERRFVNSIKAGDPAKFQRGIKKINNMKTMKNNMIPSISNEGYLASYMEQIKKFPLLEAKEEYMLAKAWKNQGDVKAAHKLVTSHLRLVAKIASGYRGYGLPLSDLISEGNIGMMHAVKRFEPEKGFRLATYAMWWIKASIQEYILRSWSLVKIGTTAAQKKLFFNLKKIKSKISAIEDGDLTPDQVDKIATELSVPHKEVISMNRRISGSDYSLNSPVTDDSSGEWQDWLEDDSQNQEASFADTEEYLIKKNILSDSLEYLNERERDIIYERQLSENPLTLEELSHRYGVSRERIRQIEAKAFEKLQTKMTEKAKDINLLQYN